MWFRLPPNARFGVKRLRLRLATRPGVSIHNQTQPRIIYARKRGRKKHLLGILSQEVLHNLRTTRRRDARERASRTRTPSLCPHAARWIRTPKGLYYKVRNGSRTIALNAKAFCCRERRRTVCIPCVMCGACFAPAEGETPGDSCPECGRPVPLDALSCPACYTLVPRPSPRSEDPPKPNPSASPRTC